MNKRNKIIFLITSLLLFMGILINPKGRSPSGHSVLEKQHLSNKMIVFQDALILIIVYYGDLD